MARKTTVRKSAPKTTRTSASVADYIAAVVDNKRRADAKAVDKMMRDVSGEKRAMWGPSIIGYGEWVNVNTLGAAPWPKIGFSPRKASLVLYVNKLADVDQKVLRELTTKSWKRMTAKYG